MPMPPTDSAEPGVDLALEDLKTMLDSLAGKSPA